MPHAWMLTYVLVMPLPESGAEAQSPEDWRAAYRAALQAAAPRLRPDSAEVVPSLTSLYRGLGEAEGFSEAERRRMRMTVKARLEQLRDRLIRERLRAEQEAERVARRTARSSSRGAEPTKAHHGGAAAGAQQLIDLITNTIEPESWEVNGGRGRIMFYPPLNVMVIRQTGEIHHQIGGALSTLRK